MSTARAVELSLFPDIKPDRARGPLPRSVIAVNAVIEAALRRYAPCPDCIPAADVGGATRDGDR